MPDATNPFPGMTPGKKLNPSELVRALRLDLTAEEDAVALYTAHAEACSDPAAKKVLLSVADEERVHIGEFQALLDRLAPGEDDKLDEGAKEVASQTKGAAKMMQVTFRKQGQPKRWITVRGKRIPITSQGLVHESHQWNPTEGELQELSAKTAPRGATTAEIDELLEHLGRTANARREAAASWKKAGSKTQQQYHLGQANAYDEAMSAVHRILRDKTRR